MKGGMYLGGCTTVNGWTNKESKYPTLPSSQQPRSSFQMIFLTGFCNRAMDFLIPGAPGLLSGLCITSYGCLRWIEAKSFCPHHRLSKHRDFCLGVQILSFGKARGNILFIFPHVSPQTHQHTDTKKPQSPDHAILLQYLPCNYRKQSRNIKASQQQKH